jgi:hypothetical protein
VACYRLAVPTGIDPPILGNREGRLLIGVEEILVSKVLCAVALVADALEKSRAPLDCEIAKDPFDLLLCSLPDHLQALLALRFVLDHRAGLLL